MSFNKKSHTGEKKNAFPTGAMEKIGITNFRTKYGFCFFCYKVFSRRKKINRDSDLDIISDTEKESKREKLPPPLGGYTLTRNKYVTHKTA